MTLAALLNEPCTITPADPDGIPVTTVCYAEQQTASEDTVNAAHQMDTWRVILPAGTAVDGHCTIDLPERGVEGLEVQGPPHQVRNPRTRTVTQIELTAARTV